MPEDPEVPTPKKKRNERTEAKFLEDADKLIAEAVREGAEYMPPNPSAELGRLQAKREEVHNQRTVNQANDATQETERNLRENLYKVLNSDARSLVNYTKSSGKSQNEVAALATIAREIGGGRAGEKGAGSISVSHMSHASRADNYARLIEQYESLAIPTTEEKYKVSTHRAKLAALRQANANVITAEANSNTSGELLDKLAYTDADSLMNGCASGKIYIKSKYGTTGEPYKNIAKTRFSLPSRLRKKK